MLFSNVSLELEGGCWTCLLGPSGIGKSTLLRLLAGLSTGGHFDGDIRSHDTDKTTSHSAGDIANMISYMAQTDLLFPWLDVRHNILLGQLLRRENSEHQNADQLIERVGLGAHAHKRPHQLSGGMRQRVALARTLMEDQPVVLLDEPFSALDARTRNEMQDLAFDTLEGKTVLLVTHDPAEAVRLAHRLYVMTEEGIHSHQTPPSLPARVVEHSVTLEAQASLLKVLKTPQIMPNQRGLGDNET